MNVNSVVADDVYRVHEQIHSNTHRPAKLKHRKAGEFREVPLPRSVREAMERYEETHGTTKDGYLLRGPSGYHTEPMERRRVQKLFKNLPVEDGAGIRVRNARPARELLDQPGVRLLNSRTMNPRVDLTRRRHIDLAHVASAFCCR